VAIKFIALDVSDPELMEDGMHKIKISAAIRDEVENRQSVPSSREIKLVLDGVEEKPGFSDDDTGEIFFELDPLEPSKKSSNKAAF